MPMELRRMRLRAAGAMPVGGPSGEVLISDVGECNPG